MYGNWKMEEWKVNEARERDGHHPETISVFNLSVLLVSWKDLYVIEKKKWDGSTQECIVLSILHANL